MTQKTYSPKALVKESENNSNINYWSQLQIRTVKCRSF